MKSTIKARVYKADNLEGIWKWCVSIPGETITRHSSQVEAFGMAYIRVNHIRSLNNITIWPTEEQ